MHCELMMEAVVCRQIAEDVRKLKVKEVSAKVTVTVLNVLGPLGEDLFGSILDRLDARSVARAAVCKEWTELARYDRRWEILYEREFGARRSLGFDKKTWFARFADRVDLVFHDALVRHTEAAPEAKMLLVGDAGIGKTWLMSRFCQNLFWRHEYAPTVGVEFGRREARFGVARRPLRLLVWDAAGMRRFSSIVMGFRKGAHAIILCYKANAGPESLHSVLDTWLQPALQQPGPKEKVIALFGLQADDHAPRTTMHHAARAVDRALAHLPQRPRIIHTQCSSGDAASVDHAFALVVRAILRDNLLGPERPVYRHADTPATQDTRLPAFDDDLLDEQEDTFFNRQRFRCNDRFRRCNTDICQPPAVCSTRPAGCLIS